jgi:tetratricopeptide (TPR) repeat protein
VNRLPFVGRDTELRKLRDSLARGAAGNGPIVLVEGEPGIGKSMLLDELLGALPTTPGLQKAIVATGQCHVGTGPQTAYQPFVEILASLDRPIAQEGRLISGFKSILKETGPDWLALIPVVGPTLGATAKTASMGFDLVWKGELTRERSAGLVDQYLAVVGQLARGPHLVVLVIEDAHWIDHASVDLLLRLQTAMEGQKLVALVTCRSGESPSDGPMERLRFELAARGRLEVVSLGGLDASDVTAYLKERFGSVIAPDLPAWLSELCRGQPLFLSQYLHLLEQERIIRATDLGYVLDGAVVRHGGSFKVEGRLAEMPTSSNIDELLDRRIRGLQLEEQEMLQVGSVQGLTFDSVVLAELTESRELSVLARLRQVAERHRIIALATGEDWQRDRSATYAFEHMLMHQAFYRRLNERERRLYHQETARILEHLLGEYERPPRKLQIDVAFHSRKGGQYAAAAAQYLQAARDTYTAGASVEAGHLAAEAIDCLRRLPAEAQDRDQCLTEAVRLRLQCAIYASTSAADIVALLEAAAEGEAAAARAGEPALLAEIVSITGHLHVRAGDVPRAIGIMRRAVELARATGDPLSEFYALTQLGMQLAKENLAESMDVRYTAHDVFRERVSLEDLPATQRDAIRRVAATSQVSIGVGEFDRGNFETAVDWLEQGIAAQRELRMFDELPAAHNYLAQVFAAMGRFEAAVRLLEDAIRLHEEHNGDRLDPWVGYNLGLLAKVLLEMGRLGSAVDVMREAVETSEATGHLDLLALVWNFQAELLMHPGNPSLDVEAAERVLRNNLAVSRASGLTRSATQAASLLGQLLIRRGALEQALEPSAEAVAELARLGDMPAVRSEEILFNHSLVLDRLGRHDEAAAHVDRAWQVVEQKLAGMRDPENRSAFVDRVPLSRAIREAHVRVTALADEVAHLIIAPAEGT